MTSAAGQEDLDPLPLWECGIALSSALAIFGAWAWLTSSGLWDGAVTSASAGYILLSALSVVLQLASNVAAAAARRARAYGLQGSFCWAVGLMTAGASYNAFSVHHAWEVTGLISTDADALFALLIIVLSVVLAGFEPALYWIDEALKGEASSRRAAFVSSISTRTSQRINEIAKIEHEPAPVTSLDQARSRRSGFGAAGAAALFAATGAAVLAPIQPVAAASSEPASKAGDRIVRPADPIARARAEEAALALLVDGDASYRRIERETGLHRDTIKRLAATIERAEIAAA